MEFLRFIPLILLFLNTIPAGYSSPSLSPQAKQSIPGFPDLYYEIQIANLNTRTPLNMYYDSRVQHYIDLYLGERRKQLAEVILRSETYFPMIEGYLKTYGIPDEIKYLPVIESAFSPVACSPSLAVGLWQFKEMTGRYYGLNVGEEKDEREDPELSTAAACKYLNDLYREFKDWDICLLAYNAGPVAVRKALLGAGPDASLRDLVSLLPGPAQNYLPALYSIIYLFNDYKSHFSASIPF